MQPNFRVLRSVRTAIRNGWSTFWSAGSRGEAKYQALLDQTHQQDQEALRIEIERVVETCLARRLGSAESTTPASQASQGGEGQ